MEIERWHNKLQVRVIQLMHWRPCLRQISRQDWRKKNKRRRETVSSSIPWWISLMQPQLRGEPLRSASQRSCQHSSCRWSKGKKKRQDRRKLSGRREFRVDLAYQKSSKRLRSQGIYSRRTLIVLRLRREGIQRSICRLRQWDKTHSKRRNQMNSRWSWLSVSMEKNSLRLGFSARRTRSMQEL